MTIPIADYFRILVVGSQYAAVATLIEENLGFATTLCSDDEAEAAVHSGADLGAIVTSRAATETREFYKKRLRAAVETYAATLMTPFFASLLRYDFDANRIWACPGHQGGQLFMRHPVGRLSCRHMGKNVFRDDICNAVVSLGDLLIHKGPALAARQGAAGVFGADRTYQVVEKGRITFYTYVVKE